MIFGGVGFMLNILGLVDFLREVKVLHFFILIGGAIFLKMMYGIVNKEVKDPITAHPLARKFFYLGMAVLATALVMRTYHLPYYKVLLYLDIFLQFVALGVSFSFTSEPKVNEDILDS